MNTPADLEKATAEWTLSESRLADARHRIREAVATLKLAERQLGTARADARDAWRRLQVLRGRSGGK